MMAIESFEAIGVDGRRRERCVKLADVLAVIDAEIRRYGELDMPELSHHYDNVIDALGRIRAELTNESEATHD